MRVIVVAAGLLGGLGVVGFAAANIPPASLPPARISASPPPAFVAEQPPTAALQAALGPASPEMRRMHKRKAKPRAGATGAKIALPKQCAGGKPNTAARPYC